MAQIFCTVGATTTESIDSYQPVWVLLPETRVPAVLPTYARQICPGNAVLVRLGSAHNLFECHFLPHLVALDGVSFRNRQPHFAAASDAIATFAGDIYQRVKIFLAYLAERRLIDSRLYPIIERTSQKLPMTRRDTKPLFDVTCAGLKKSFEVTEARKRSILNFLETGSCDGATMLWLALAVDPRFALHVLRDHIAVESQNSVEAAPARDNAALERDLRDAIGQMRTGGDCTKDVGGIELKNWLTSLIGCTPRQRFFVEAGEVQEGINKAGCLKFDSSKFFHDFGVEAPRFISLDKLSRAVTAFDRTLSHLTIRFCLDDDEMKQLSGDHPVSSGMFLRGIMGDESEAMRTLYPSRSIPNQSDLSERLIEKTRAAISSGSLARVCGRHYGIPESQLQRGLLRLLSVFRKTLPLVPTEVHALAAAIEGRIQLQRLVERLKDSGDRVAQRQQARQIEIAMRAQVARQFGLAKRLKADFHVDPSKMFYIDNMLIDRLKALFGNELEFMRRILADYIARHNASHQSANIDDSIVVNH